MRTGQEGGGGRREGRSGRWRGVAPAHDGGAAVVSHALNAICCAVAVCLFVCGTRVGAQGACALCAVLRSGQCPHPRARHNRTTGRHVLVCAVPTMCGAWRRRRAVRLHVGCPMRPPACVADSMCIINHGLYGCACLPVARRGVCCCDVFVMCVCCGCRLCAGVIVAHVFLVVMMYNSNSIVRLAARAACCSSHQALLATTQLRQQLLLQAPPSHVAILVVAVAVLGIVCVWMCRGHCILFHSQQQQQAACTAGCVLHAFALSLPGQACALRHRPCGCCIWRPACMFFGL